MLPPMMTEKLRLRDGHSAGEGRDLNWGPSVLIITQPCPTVYVCGGGKDGEGRVSRTLGGGIERADALSTHSPPYLVKSDSLGPVLPPKQALW